MPKTGPVLRKTRAERPAIDGRLALARLLEVIDMLPEALVFFDADDRLVLWNRLYAELYADIADILVPGITFEEMLRTSLSRGNYPESMDDQDAWLADRLLRHRNPSGVVEQRFRDGRWVRHEERRTADGGIIGMQVDISELKQREQSFRLLFEDNPVPMWLCRIADGRLVEVNAAAIRHYGFDRDLFLSMREADLLAEPEAAVRGPRPIPAPVSGVGPVGEADPGLPQLHRRADGSLIRVLAFSRDLRQGPEPIRLVAIVDVTQRLEAEAQVARMAAFDDLTGLPNRRILHRSLEQALKEAVPGRTLAVHYIDLDHFKLVNDTLGHPVGDGVLKVVAERLQASAPNLVVARLGGDEFAILQPDLGDRTEAATLAMRLIAVLDEPFTVHGHRIIPSASIGIALSPKDGSEADVLLRNADTALYQAKAEGRARHRFYQAEMGERIRRRRALELDLRSALDSYPFELHFQPIVDLTTHRPLGYEALVRWQHPSLGMVPPSDFIPLAEETGLISPLGDWIIRQACAAASRWPAGLRVAINLSPVQFRHTGLVQTVVSALASTGLPPARLELEITEAALLRNNQATLSTLHQFRALGIRIALDDFGTGFSSLSHLRSFSFDKIKIDRSFVRDMDSHADCEAIVRAVAGLGASLRVATTAEGIETKEQARFVREVGCTEGQGFWFGRPCAAADLVFGAAPDP